MSAIISILPIVMLFVLMLGFKVVGWKSALITLLFALALGFWVAPLLDIVPGPFAGESIYALMGMSVVEGALKAVFPILIIILMAIYSYNILVESRQIEIIKQQFTALTNDRGILVLVMVWGFGGLLEGMAGFGTAVAIPAAILIGLGFKPMFSALVALLGNTVPTCFGAVGVPVTTLCNEISAGGAASAHTVNDVSAFAVIQIAPLFILIPFAILMLTNRRAWLKNICIALWVGVISFGVQLACATLIGPETPAILGSIAGIFATIAYDRLFLRRRKTAAAMVSDSTVSVSTETETKSGTNHVRYTFAQTFRAWSVYIFILVFILVGGPLCPPVSDFLKSHWVSAVNLPVLGSVFKFGWLSNAGLMLFLGSIVGGLIQGLSVRKLAMVLARTVINLRFTIITIISLISLASVMNYSGMIAAIASGLVALTGSFYPFFAPLIGAVGTFVTGSDTSSNILFGKLQANVAGQLGLSSHMDFCGFGGSQSEWLAASNAAGATGGKMISPQSVAVATAACDMRDADDALLRKALPYAAGYIVITGLVVILGL